MPVRSRDAEGGYRGRIAYRFFGGSRDPARPELFTDGAFKTTAIPAAEIGGGAVGAFKKGHQRRLRVRRFPDGVIGQQELSQLRIEIRSPGSARRIAKAFRG